MYLYETFLNSFISTYEKFSEELMLLIMLSLTVNVAATI